MKRFSIALPILLVMLSEAFAQLKTPSEFLGYELGDAFTRHHRVVEYFRHVDEVMPNVKIIQYGETYEGRPLIVAVIASPENFSKLDVIREDNLRRAGILPGQTSTKVGIVWLSYNVHGNEANSTETSMKTLYELVQSGNQKSAEWLKNTVVIIDPCINPDGRDRYANFYNQYGNFPPNPDPQAREHREPWPGGRPNHYLYDLNRDWAWMTQKESSARIKLYNQWLPHVHVDFHEQGYNNPYYFAPAAEPYHEVITPWQREFQDMIGRNHAKYFDAKGWLYFTKERFDLYYPSYGDTYPTYSGAIGMTYEKGGIGAGLNIITREGDPLTLKDRIENHYTTGMSTVEISSINMDRLVDEFAKFNKETINNLSVPYKSYVIRAENNKDKLALLSTWLDAHGISHGLAGVSRQVKGFDYQSRQTGTFTVGAEDLVFNVYQQKGRFITTVFEPVSKLTDSLTYDITAWNLIYGSGLKAVALTERVNSTKPVQPVTPNAPANNSPYAYVCRYESMLDIQFLSALLKSGVKIRTAMKPFQSGKQKFEPGSLVITRRNNEEIKDFDALIRKTANEFGRNLFVLESGYMDAGPDVGSSDFVYIKSPKIALLGGEQTSSQSHGQIWHYFEQIVHYPVSIIGTDYFNSIDLWKYDVLIIPEGSYRLFTDELLTTISRWIGDGGRIILIGTANNSFAERKGFNLKNAEKPNEEKPGKNIDKRSEQLLPYEDSERTRLSSSIFGAIYKVTLDKTHPLAFGVGEIYYSLKTSGLHFPYLETGFNVGTIRSKTVPFMGFAGTKINKELEQTMVFGTEERGAGRIIYLVDNPLFRSFWENGKMIFSNAVFMSGAGF